METKRETMSVTEASKALNVAIANMKLALLADENAAQAKDIAEGGEKGVRAISDTVVEQILNLISQAMNLFESFGDTFSPADRTRLIGVGIKNFGFTETVLNETANNPDLIPPYVKAAKFKDKVSDFKRKKTIETRLDRFLILVADSLLSSGDAAYHDALEIYSYAKEAAKRRVPGAEALYKKLAPYFKKSKPQGNEPTEAQVERDVRGLLHGTKDGKIVIENERPTASRGKQVVVDDIHSGEMAHHVASDAVASV
jgi:site-specific DNA-cytosine methylase